MANRDLNRRTAKSKNLSTKVRKKQTESIEKAADSIKKGVEKASKKAGKIATSGLTTEESKERNEARKQAKEATKQAKETLRTKVVKEKSQETKDKIQAKKEYKPIAQSKNPHKKSESTNKQLQYNTANSVGGRFIANMGGALMDYNPIGEAITLATGKTPTSQSTYINPYEEKLTSGFAAGAGRMVGLGANYIGQSGALDAVFTRATNAVLSTKVGQAIKSSSTIGKVGAKVGDAIIDSKTVTGAERVAQGLVKNTIEDLTLGVATNAVMDYGEGLRGKDFAKQMAIDTAFDLGIGGIVNGAPLVKAAIDNTNVGKLVNETPVAKISDSIQSENPNAIKSNAKQRIKNSSNFSENPNTNASSQIESLYKEGMTREEYMDVLSKEINRIEAPQPKSATLRTKQQKKGKSNIVEKFNKKVDEEKLAKNQYIDEYTDLVNMTDDEFAEAYKNGIPDKYIKSEEKTVVNANRNASNVKASKSLKEIDEMSDEDLLKEFEAESKSIDDEQLGLFDDEEILYEELDGKYYSSEKYDVDVDETEGQFSIDKTKYNRFKEEHKDWSIKQLNEKYEELSIKQKEEYDKEFAKTGLKTGGAKTRQERKYYEKLIKERTETLASAKDVKNKIKKFNKKTQETVLDLNDVGENPVDLRTKANLLAAIAKKTPDNSLKASLLKKSRKLKRLAEEVESTKTKNPDGTFSYNWELLSSETKKYLYDLKDIIDDQLLRDKNGKTRFDDGFGKTTRLMRNVDDATKESYYTMNSKALKKMNTFGYNKWREAGANEADVSKYFLIDGSKHSDIGMPQNVIDKIIKSIEERSGVKVEYVDFKNPDANGLYSNGVIKISKDSSNPIYTVLKHELTHRLQESELYREYADFILNGMKKNDFDIDGLKAEIKKSYLEDGIKLNDEQAEQELVAIFSSEYLFNSEESIRRLARENRSLFDKIYEWITDSIQKIKNTTSKDTSANFLIDAQRKFEKALDSKSINKNVDEISNWNGLTIEKEGDKLFEKSKNLYGEKGNKYLETKADKTNAKAEAKSTLNDKTINTKVKVNADSSFKDITSRYDNGKDVSKHAETIYNAPFTTEEGKQAILDNLDKMLKETVPNKAVIDKAVASVNKDAKKLYDSFISKVDDGLQFTNQDVANSIELQKHLIKNGDYDSYIEVVARSVACGSETGRTMQSMKMYHSLTPDGRAYSAVKTVQRLKQKTGIDITIDNKYLDAIYKANTDEEILKANKEFAKMVWDQIPVSLGEKLDAWRYLSMLGNPKTHIRNILGNAIYLPARIMSDAISTGIEKGVAKSKADFTGTHAIVGYTGSDKELRNAAKEQFKIHRTAMEATSSKYIESVRPQELKIFNNKILEALRQINYKGLEGEDQFFMKLNYESAFAQYCKAKGKKASELTEEFIKEASEYAEMQALRATYRDPSKLADAIGRFKKNIKAKPTDNIPMKAIKGTSSMAVESIVPFVKTPINILARGLEYSPVGFTRGIYDIATAKTQEDLLKGIMYFSEGLTGTGLMAVGMYMANQGYVNGSLGEWDKTKTYKSMLGEQDYAISIGDKTFTFDWAAPLSMPFFVGVELANKDNGSNIWEKIEALEGITDPVFEMSMLSGIDNVFDTAFEDGSPVVNIAKNSALNYVNQFVPTLSGQIARTKVNARKTTISTADSELQREVEKQVQKLMNKTPFTTKYTQDYVDQWGRTDDGGGWFDRAFENFFSPAYISEKNITDVDKELMNVMEQLDEDKQADVIPAVSNSAYKVKFEDNEYKMTASEFTQYKKTVGQTRYKGLEELFATDDYKNASADEKRKMIMSVYDDGADAGKEEFLLNSGKVTKEQLAYSQLTNTQKASVDNGTITAEKMLEVKTENADNGITANSAGVLIAYTMYGKKSSEIKAYSDNVTDKAIEKANLLKSANVALEDYQSFYSEADYNGSGNVSIEEAKTYFSQYKQFSKKQKYAMTYAATGATKKNPYK